MHSSLKRKYHCSWGNEKQTCARHCYRETLPTESFYLGMYTVPLKPAFMVTVFISSYDHKLRKTYTVAKNTPLNKDVVRLEGFYQ